MTLEQWGRLPPYPALTPATPMPAFYLPEHINGSSNWVTRTNIFQIQPTILWCTNNPHEDAIHKIFLKY